MRFRKKEGIAWIAGIFLLALLVRIYAFTSLPRRAITDDAYEYNYIAQHIVKAVTGAQIEYKDTFLRYGASRGWLFPLFIAAVYQMFGNQPQYVMLLQMLLDAFTCVLIYALGKEIFSKRVGIAAALLSAFYPAFLYYSTMLYQETTTIFLLTLFVLLLCRAIRRKKPSLYFVPGVLIMVISFYRSGFLFFSLFTAPVLFVILWFHYNKDRLLCFFYFCMGVCCMVVLYGAFSYRVSGSFTFNKPSIAWSIYETTHRDGWVTDTFAPTPTEELREVAQEYSYALSADSHRLGLPPQMYLIATFRYIRNNLLSYLSQFITRCKRMWTYIETYPGRWHDPIVWGQIMFHRALIILALMGIPLSLTVWHHSALFIAIFLYLTVAFIPTIGLPRYAVPAMPFVIILAAYTAFFLVSILGKLKNQLMYGSLRAPLLFTGVMAVMVCYLDIPLLLRLFPPASPIFCYTITIILTNLFLITATFFLYRIFTLSSRGKRSSRRAILFSLVTLMLIYNNDALASKTWQEWQVPLSSTRQKIKQTIVLPADFNPDAYREAHVVIDMFPGGGQDYSFHVEANGELIKSYPNGIKAKEGKFDNTFFGLYKSFFFDTYKLKPEDLRQWYEIELPQHLLQNSTHLVIECSLDGMVDRNKNHVVIFGDYQTTSDSNFYVGPCIPRGDEDTSLAKIMPYSGDYRFERVTPLYSIKTQSEYYNCCTWQKEDISGTPGIQSGSYRIRVELISNDGSQVIL